MKQNIIYFLCAFWICIVTTETFSQVEDDAFKHAKELLSSCILIDGHNDLIWSIREKLKVSGDLEDYNLRKHTDGDTDIPKLREGHIGGQFWSVWIPPELGNGFAKVQLEQIELARRIIEHYSDTFTLALTASEVEEAFQNGRIASLLGMEGGYAIENSLGALRAYYALGVRYMTLTHGVKLDWADSATDTLKHDGLTPFGKEVVREMNRLGMLVDLSHVSAKTMSDALDVSEAPIIFSHSSARSLTDHPRNVPDSVLTRIPANGGIVMVTFYPSYVSQDVADWEAPLNKQTKGKNLSTEEWDRIYAEYAKTHPMPRASLSQVADHIEYIVKISGIDHVGIGSDFWGGGTMPKGLEDSSKYPYLFAELIRRGWNDAELRKLAGENILRVLRNAEIVAKRIQANRSASNRSIEDLDKNIK